MTRIDTWWLQRCERFAHWTQDWFGITSYRWGQLLTVWFALTLVISILNYFFPLPAQLLPPTPWGLLIVLPLMMIWAQAFWGYFTRAQANWREGRTALQPLSPMLQAIGVWQRQLFFWAALLALAVHVGLRLPWRLDSPDLLVTLQLLYMLRVHPRPYQRRRVLVPLKVTN